MTAFVLSLSVAGVMGVMGVGASANDDKGRLGYRYLAATGMTELGWLCPLGPGCPDTAVADSGDTIEVTGEGTFRISEGGDPKGVTGGGSFRHLDAARNVVAVGTWTARKLIRFESFGPDEVTPLPRTWEAGLARILVDLRPDGGRQKLRAVLEVGCQLPGNPGPSGNFEGIKLRVTEGPNFDMFPHGSTLFINLGIDGDDDDD